MKEFPCIESTLEFEIDGLLVRIWRDAEDLDQADHDDHRDIMDIASVHLYANSKVLLARKLCELPRINAVQVVDLNSKLEKRGIIAYVNWP